MSGLVSRATAGTAAGSDRSVSRETTAPRPGAATAIVLAPLRAYRRLLSPLLGQRCRYYPTCSSYAEQAIRELGPLRGLIVAGWRLLRCNPLSSGGFDAVSERRLFRGRRSRSRSARRRRVTA